MSHIGKWVHLSGYRLRFAEFKYERETIYLKIQDQRGRHNHPRNNSVLMQWSCRKFADCKFEIEINAYKEFSWKKVFSKLKISLAYQFNPPMRKVHDRLNMKRVSVLGDFDEEIVSRPHIVRRHRGKG